LEHGRIGHDKNLFPDWVVADGPWVKVPPGIPGYLDQQWVAEAAAALQCPATKAVLSSVRSPMTPHRFVSNFVNSYEFTQYRIDRVPLYELVRCGLDVPDAGPPAPRE
jgi:arabinofuranosyltransferase